MAYSYSAAVEASLELIAERGIDPTSRVYERAFEKHPDMRLLFWRDKNGAVKGEMLARLFAAILDFVGERHYADHMIGTELVTHEGYDVPREVFVTFFATVGEVVRELLGGDWTAEMEIAWADMLADVEAYAARVPRSDVAAPAFAHFREDAARRLTEAANRGA